MIVPTEGFPSTLFCDIEEAGLRTIKTDYRVILRNVCKLKGIQIGDAITVYIKKIPETCDSPLILEAGLRTVQVDYRIALKDICKLAGLEIGDPVVVYFKKTELSSKE